MFIINGHYILQAEHMSETSFSRHTNKLAFDFISEGIMDPARYESVNCYISLARILSNESAEGFK